MEKENRRIKMTKLLLTESFLQLLEQKPLSRVTVKEICAHADLNRSTYYRYFSNPYDQMEKLEKEIIEEMLSWIDAESGERKLYYDAEGLYSLIKQILDYIDSKKDMFLILLSNNRDLSLQKDILTVLAEKLLTKEVKDSADNHLLQKFVFTSTGCFGLIYYWLVTDRQEATEELSKRISEYCLEVFQHEIVK
ncbi:hypothetical protein BAU15_05445 [Enterococcus sp. JM4C]|uniref:TetR/AcrR family transcriptional regulator n=1 Tax=Candidatus Enterococcus huntleyi TaxID=1857217 RepID=UPI001379AE7B|nr:TetR/AcrR family transcriptional regulator [Enterococcus sp. JM4C]KAF1295195.1 hypothetical protein BAU15_05445 [Enterococcus sp. JM4C]